MDHQLLLVDCPDDVGLIYKITGVLYDNGCNIVRNQEFVDEANGRFFMRSEYVGDAAPDVIVPSVQAVLSPRAHVRVAPVGGRRVVVLATREAHCLGELLLKHAEGDLGAEIQAVISNHSNLEDLTRRFDVPFHTVSHEGISRDEHESRISDIISDYEPEYLVLAKYMRVLTPDFLRRYAGRIINIHHSFLPAFVGAQPYRQAFQRGVKIIGATAHFVTEALDEGPIIAQNVIPVDHTYSPETMAKAGRDVEKLVLARAIKLVLEERVFLVGNRTVVFE